MLSKDFKEFAELLDSNGVEYLIVGGYALAAYGHPRYTGDLDFWVGTDPGNAKRLLQALKSAPQGGCRIGPISKAWGKTCRIEIRVSVARLRGLEAGMTTS
jgi:hypothetical protein